ncbi:hypothetical protein BU17DRAFT_63787 [Hysterangium stoloniferum]|nr:hypothetical protein BU17DRAFT_63787 [Hysterangium stoloniferum]
MADIDHFNEGSDYYKALYTAAPPSPSWSSPVSSSTRGDILPILEPHPAANPRTGKVLFGSASQTSFVQQQSAISPRAVVPKRCNLIYLPQPCSADRDPRRRHTAHGERGAHQGVGVFGFEGFANRENVPFAELYHIPEAEVLRGTLSARSTAPPPHAAQPRGSSTSPPPSKGRSRPVLVPYTYHTDDIRFAVREKTGVVTTSSVSPAIDPGIYYFYAIKTIGEIHDKGRKARLPYIITLPLASVDSLLSHSGGLPSSAPLQIQLALPRGPQSAPQPGGKAGAQGLGEGGDDVSGGRREDCHVGDILSGSAILAAIASRLPGDNNTRDQVVSGLRWIGLLGAEKATVGWKDGGEETLTSTLMRMATLFRGDTPPWRVFTPYFGRRADGSKYAGSSKEARDMCELLRRGWRRRAWDVAREALMFELWSWD